MAGKVLGLSLSPRSAAVLLGSSALSGGPAQVGDAGFDRILSQLKDFHDRMVDALLDKINKLKEERCLDAMKLEEVFNSNLRLKEQLRRQETNLELQLQRQAAGAKPGGLGDDGVGDDGVGAGAGRKGSACRGEGRLAGRPLALRLSKGSPVRKRVRYRHLPLERRHDGNTVTSHDHLEQSGPQGEKDVVLVPDSLALDAPDVKPRVIGADTWTEPPGPPSPRGPPTTDRGPVRRPSEPGSGGGLTPELGISFLFRPRRGRVRPTMGGDADPPGPPLGSPRRAAPSPPDAAASSDEAQARSPLLLGRKPPSQEPARPASPEAARAVGAAQPGGRDRETPAAGDAPGFSGWKVPPTEAAVCRGKRRRERRASDGEGGTGRRADADAGGAGARGDFDEEIPELAGGELYAGVSGAAPVGGGAPVGGAVPAGTASGAGNDRAAELTWSIDPDLCLSPYETNSLTAQAPRSPRFGGPAAGVRDEDSSDYGGGGDDDDDGGGDDGDDDDAGDLSVDCTFVNESVLLRHGGGSVRNDGGATATPFADGRPVRQAVRWSPITPSGDHEDPAAGRELASSYDDSLNDLFERTCGGEEYDSLGLDDPSALAHPDQSAPAYPDQSAPAYPRSNDESTLTYPNSPYLTTLTRPRSPDQTALVHPRSNDHLTLAHPRSNDESTVAHPTNAHPSSNDQLTITQQELTTRPHRKNLSPLARQRSPDRSTVAHPSVNDRSTLARPRSKDQPTLARRRSPQQELAAHPPRSSDRSTDARPLSPDLPGVTGSKPPAQEGCGHRSAAGAGSRAGAGQPGFAYVDVVRRKDERKKLLGFSCKQCENFFAHLPAEQQAAHAAECSRHRARFQPPNTPDNFWEIGFPSTQTCHDRGYLKEEDEPANRLRRKRPYNATFSPARKQATHTTHDAQ